MRKMKSDYAMYVGFSSTRVAVSQSNLISDSAYFLAATSCCYLFKVVDSLIEISVIRGFLLGWGAVLSSKLFLN